MKKILVAFDGTNFSEGAFEFARQMNQQSPVMVTGIFLPQVDYSNLWSYAEGVAHTTFTPLVEEQTINIIQKNISRFESLCRKNGIEYQVHKDFLDLAMSAVKKETRFADLLIIGSESFYESLGINEPNESLKDALHRSECPILIVPEKFDCPETNILAYNGSRGCVYAMKQFAYLFPEFSGNETLLVYAKEEDEADFPDESYIEEFAGRHFANLTLMKLQLDPKKYFHTWIEDCKAAIVVTGAFGRSGLSQSLKKSFITDVIRDHKMPVFVAHV